MNARSGRPVVGVTSYDARASWGAWDAPACLVPSGYLESLVAAGAAPVVLVTSEASEEVLDRLDGVVLSGGPDLDPARYGAEAHPRSQPPRPARDAFELALVEGAARRNLPLLAICRGLQVLNVARGGSLHQHLPDLIGSDAHLPSPGVYGTTSVSPEPGSRLAAALGTEALLVDCHHHQVVESLGAGLVVNARALDGTVEGLEDPSADFVLAVQWHPETAGGALFGAFVEACARRGPVRAPDLRTGRR